MKISFKNIAYLAVALFGMSFVSSCSNDLEQVNEPEKKVYTFTASATPNSVNSRTTHTESGNDIVVKWELDDVVYVGVLSDTYVGKKINQSADFVQFKVTELSNEGKTATLTYNGTLPSTWTTGSKLLYYYGKADQATIRKQEQVSSEDYGKLFLQCSYQGLVYPDPYLKQFDLLSGVAEYNGDGNIPNINMEHIGAILRFEFSFTDFASSEKKVDRITISTSDASFFQNISLWEDGRKLSNGTTNSLTSNQKPGNIKLNIKDNKSVMYRVVAPTDLIEKKDITVTLMVGATTDDGGNLVTAGPEYTGTVKNVRSVKAGILYSTPVIPMTKVTE